MAGRSNTELKVFLNGSLTDYQAFCQDPNAKLGSVFFNKNDHTIYVEGDKVVGTQVENVVWDNDNKILTIYPISGAPIPVELGVDEALKNLENALKAWVNSEFEAKDATILRQTDVVNNLTTDSATVPLSAAQGKELKRQIDEKVTAETGKGLSTNDYTDGDKNKLDGIEPGAQTNRDVLAVDVLVGDSYNDEPIVLAGNLVDKSKASSGEVDFNLSMWHDSTNNKIHFFNLPKEQANSSNVDKALFSIDTTDFVKDGILSNAEYNEQTHILTLTFNSDAGKAPIPIDLSDLVNVYKASNGITLDGDTFKLALGDGVKVEDGSLTLSLGNGLAFDDSGNLKVDFASNSVTSINGMGGGAYTINSKGVTVGTYGHAFRPVDVVGDQAAKKLEIRANPKDIFAQFFHENSGDATSGIRAVGVEITENETDSLYSMLMDFTPKVWKFKVQ